MLKWTGFATTLLAAVATVALAILLLTRTGVDLLINAAQRVAPELAVVDWEGYLLGTICAGELSYRTAAVRVDAEDICINLNLWRSLDQLRLSFGSLRAAAIAIEVPASAPDAERRDGYAPALPFSIELDAVAVQRFRYRQLVLSDASGSASVSSARLDLDAAFGFENHAFTLRTSGRWQALEVTAALVRPQPITLTGSVDLTRSELPYRAVLSGALIDLAEWTPLALQLSQSRLAVSGDLQDYEFELTTRASAPAFGDAAVQSAGAGDLEGLTMETTATLTPATDLIERVETVNVRGTIGWQPGLAFTLSATTPAVTARIGSRSLTIGGELNLVGSPADLLLQTPSLQGELDQVPFTAAGSLRWHDGLIDVDSTTIDIGEGSLQLAGRIAGDATPVLNATATRLPLDVVDARLRGELSGTLSLTGYPENTLISAELNGSRVGIAAFDSEEVVLGYRGSLSRGEAEFELRHALGQVEGTTEVFVAPDDYQARINTLDATLADPVRAETIALALRSPTTLRYASGQLHLDPACFQTRLSDVADLTSETCLSLDYPAGPALLRIEDLTLPMIKLPVGDLAAAAKVNADIRVASFSPLQLQAELKLSDLVAHIEDYHRELGELALHAAVDADQARLRISSPEQQFLVSNGELRAELADPLADSQLDGSIRVAIEGIRLVEEFLPMELAFELSQLHGQITADAVFRGPVRAPEIDANVAMSDAGWLLNVSGTEFRDVAMNARLEETDTVTLTAAGGLGNGTFELDGTLQDLGSDEPRLTSHIELEDGRVLELPDYTASLSGALDLAVTPAALEINGDLQMPEARIVIADLPEAAVSASRDTVIVGSQAAPAPQQVRTSRIVLELGERVHLTAFGLDTRLRGSLTLTETPGKPPDLRGVVTLQDGIFKAYGQELTVERGRLTFIGPIDDPVVDVVASRTVPRSSGDVQVFLTLSGSAKAIETAIRSDPLMPEGDALALLLTGRTLSEMTSGEQTNAYGAAIALGLYGASGIRRNLADTIGLEEIIVEQDRNGEWEVGAAVRLQENLYVRYTYSVFSRIGGVLLRYRLSEHISVQAKTGDAHSIEIRYGVD